MTRSDVEKGHPDYYQDLAEKIARETKDAFYINQFGNLAKQGNTLIVPANLTDVASMIGAAMSVIRAGQPSQPGPNRPPQPPPVA